MGVGAGSPAGRGGTSAGAALPGRTPAVSGDPVFVTEVFFLFKK